MKATAAPGAQLRQAPVPQPGPNDVLVRVSAASICGTDLHIYRWDRWSERRIHPPLIFGHEFCGMVESAGAEVRNVAPGDFVSAEMHVACGQCFMCRTGQRHICQNVRIIGIDADGCFAQFVRVPAENIWKIDPAIPVEYAAVLDPLGNAVHTVLAGEVGGLSVAVVGCGPIGLFSIAVAKACGAGPILAFEPQAYRRGLAEKMGATHVIDSSQADPVAAALNYTDGLGPEVVLEMSGHPVGVRQAFQMLRRGGRISLLGIPSKPLEVDFANDIIFKGATVQGINGRRVFGTWYRMQALLKSGLLNISPLITNRLPLSRFQEGIDLLLEGAASKVLLFPDGQPSAT